MIASEDLIERATIIEEVRDQLRRRFGYGISLRLLPESVILSYIHKEIAYRQWLQGEIAVVSN